MKVDGFLICLVPEMVFLILGESPGFPDSYLKHVFFCSAWPIEVSSLESGECFVSVTVPGKSFVSFDSFLETARYLSFESFTKRLILGLQDYEMLDWRKSLLGMDHDLMIMVLNM